MISEISPFKDFVCIKVCHNRRVRCFGIVLVCPCLYTNRTSKELQTLLSLFFFRNLSFQIGGAAYLRVRLIHGTLRYFASRECLRVSSICARWSTFEISAGIRAVLLYRRSQALPTPVLVAYPGFSQPRPFTIGK